MKALPIICAAFLTAISSISAWADDSDFMIIQKRPTDYNLWQIRVVSEADELTITKMVVNRNNCHITNVSSLIGNPMKFGDDVVLTMQCDPIEFTIETDKGNGTYTWRP